MRTRRVLLATLCCLSASSATAYASGVTTHAFMGEAAIPFVTDPDLRALLEAHPDEVIAGAHFPDGGYVAGGYGEVTHWERFVNAYVRHLKRRGDCGPFTAAAGPCAQQVAYLMGIAAHGIGDERWDWLFEPKLADFGESPVHPGYATYSEAGLPGAAELSGLPPGSLINTPEFALDNIGLVEFDRLRKIPRFAPPTDDLLAVYRDLGRDDITEEGILMGHGAIIAAVTGERAGVASEYPRVKATIPRVSALYYTGTGGILDVAQAAAGYYGSVFKKLTSDVHPAPVVTAVNPLPDSGGVPISWNPVNASPGPDGGGSENRIMASISNSLDTPTITADGFRLYGPDGERLAMEDGFPKPGPYGAGDGTHTLMLWPQDDLQPCSRYTAELNGAVKDHAGAGLADPFRWSFTTRSADGRPCPPRSAEPPVGPPPGPGPGSGGTTTMDGSPPDPAVTATPQTVAAPPSERGTVGLPATSTLAIRGLSRTPGKGRTLRLLVSCLGPDACSGTMRLVASPGRGARTVGTTRYTIAPFKTQSLRFTLTRAQRSQLTRKRRLALDARASQDAVRGGPGAVTSRGFVLRAVPPRN